MAAQTSCSVSAAVLASIGHPVLVRGDPGVSPCFAAHRLWLAWHEALLLLRTASIRGLLLHSFRAGTAALSLFQRGSFRDRCITRYRTGHFGPHFLESAKSWGGHSFPGHVVSGFSGIRTVVLPANVGFCECEQICGSAAACGHTGPRLFGFSAVAAPARQEFSVSDLWRHFCIDFVVGLARNSSLGHRKHRCDGCGIFVGRSLAPARSDARSPHGPASGVGHGARIYCAFLHIPRGALKPAHLL